MLITVFKNKVPFLFLVTCTCTLVCVTGALLHHISGCRKDGPTSISPHTKSRIKTWLACIKHIPVSGSYYILAQIFGSHCEPLKVGNTPTFPFVWLSMDRASILHWERTTDFSLDFLVVCEEWWTWAGDTFQQVLDFICKLDDLSSIPVPRAEGENRLLKVVFSHPPPYAYMCIQKNYLKKGTQVKQPGIGTKI